jgi:hypothetical protein
LRGTAIRQWRRRSESSRAPAATPTDRFRGRPMVARKRPWSAGRTRLLVPATPRHRTQSGSATRYQRQTIGPRAGRVVATSRASWSLIDSPSHNRDTSRFVTSADGHARSKSFLDDFKSTATADQKDVVGQRQPPLQHGMAHDLVYGIVAADLLPPAHQFTVGSEQRRRVQSPRLPEHRLRRPQPIRKVAEPFRIHRCVARWPPQSSRIDRSNGRPAANTAARCHSSTCVVCARCGECRISRSQPR